jgi:hypothetical protein
LFVRVCVVGGKTAVIDSQGFSGAGAQAGMSASRLILTKYNLHNASKYDLDSPVSFGYFYKKRQTSSSG